jgi:hypothetical protein
MPHPAPFEPTASLDQEVEVLRRQAESMEGALETVRRRIEELEAGKKAE